MKPLVAGMCMLAVLGCFLGMAFALELSDGFMEMQWASPAGQYEALDLLYEKEKVTAYVQPHIVHTIGDIPVPNVIYGFYDDQFFAVYIQLESEEAFGSFRSYLQAHYGIPETSLSMKTGETVYEWRHETVKIKLKTNEKSHRMKLGFYYMPLSRRLNAEQIEKWHDKSIQFFPVRKDKLPEMIPLLQF